MRLEALRKHLLPSRPNRVIPTRTLSSSNGVREVLDATTVMMSLTLSLLSSPTSMVTQSSDHHKRRRQQRHQLMIMSTSTFPTASAEATKAPTPR